MKGIAIVLILLLGVVGISILCSYQEQHNPTHKIVEGHDYVAVGTSWQHNPECPKCKN